MSRIALILFQSAFTVLEWLHRVTVTAFVWRGLRPHNFKVVLCIIVKLHFLLALYDLVPTAEIRIFKPRVYFFCSILPVNCSIESPLTFTTRFPHFSSIITLNSYSLALFRHTVRAVRCSLLPSYSMFTGAPPHAPENRCILKHT
jgi:hypothetical protein